jgi:hypothetical protein
MPREGQVELSYRREGCHPQSNYRTLDQISVLKNNKRPPFRAVDAALTLISLHRSERTRLQKLCGTWFNKVFLLALNSLPPNTSETCVGQAPQTKFQI